MNVIDGLAWACWVSLGVASALVVREFWRTKKNRGEA